MTNDYHNPYTPGGGGGGSTPTPTPTSTPMPGTQITPPFTPAGPGAGTPVSPADVFGQGRGSGTGGILGLAGNIANQVAGNLGVQSPDAKGIAALAAQYGVDPSLLSYLISQGSDPIAAAQDLARQKGNLYGQGGGGSDPALLALQREQLEWQKRSDTLNAYIDELHEKVYSEQITREEALKQLELQIDAQTAAQTARREASQWAVDPNAKYFPGFEPEGVVGQVFKRSSGMPFPGLSTTPIKTSPGAITAPLPTTAPAPIDLNSMADAAWADVKAKAGI